MEKLELGDIVLVDRGLYQHYGIYIGHGKVINYAAEDGDFGGPISIHESSLKHFLKGEECYKIKFPSDYDGLLYSPEATVRRAKSRLGEQEYNLLSNNCEHFAWWCKTGESRSDQVEKVMKNCTSVLSGGLPIIDMIYEILFGNNESADDSESAITIMHVEVITINMIFDFFKKPAIFNKLLGNKNLAAIAIKKLDEDTGEILVYGCIFNKQKNEVVASDEKDIFVLSTKKLEDKLDDLFGNKDMIILQ